MGIDPSQDETSKGRFQNKILKKWLDLSIQAAWLGSEGGQNPTKKNCFQKKIQR